MKKVIIEGTMYLGTLVKNEDKTFTLKKAYRPESLNLSQRVFADYLKAKNLSDLEEVEFGGTGSSYTISKLTKDQKLDLKVVKLTMQRALALAAPTTENRMLDTLLGK